jgi:arylsulfatase
MRGGKSTLWEGGHRVPCFIRWPDGQLRRPGDVRELTQVQDLLPTLIDLCGLQAPPHAKFDGTSLAPLLRGTADSLPDRTLVIHYSRVPWDSKRLTRGSAAIPRRDGAAVLWKRWRLLYDSELYNLDVDPGQTQNVIEKHPQIAARMRGHYAKWWDAVKDQVNVPERIVVGHHAANPMLLSSCEWYDVIVDQQRQVRLGDQRNGALHLEIAETGSYEFELRRWPREAELPLRAGLPETRVTDGVYAAGVSLPITEARLSIGGIKYHRRVAEEDAAATFQTLLESGPTDVATHFLDRSGHELCGAYYLYVKRLP